MIECKYNNWTSVALNMQKAIIPLINISFEHPGHTFQMKQSNHDTLLLCKRQVEAGFMPNREYFRLV